MELKSYSLHNGLTDGITIDMAQQHQNMINNNNNTITANNDHKNKVIFSVKGEDPAVKLSDVSIGFFRKPVVAKLHITVPKAKIYSILGSKKCGKTLILQCIAGLIEPTKGEVRVMGESPGRCRPVIGYMPQEISLFDAMTVEETMKYFGQLYGLSGDTVNNKIEYLVDSLSTKLKNSLIRGLTNNDKVIVSLAVTVLHSPRILLLDEPTLYCDPLLKKSIWYQLRGLCAIEGVTIIVATNHVEEAKYADIVGFVRNGSLKEEELPKHLSKELAADSVEDLFVNLFSNHLENAESVANLGPNTDNLDNSRRLAMNSNHSFNEMDVSSVGVKPLHTINSSSTDRISALYYKNLKGQVRNAWLLIFQLFYPALAIALFCACIGKNPYEIPVGVYNPDRPSFVSDIILNSFNPKIIQLHYYDTFDTAFEAVRQHNVWAMMSFPHNYTRSMLQRSSQGCESSEDMTDLDVEEETVEESVIHNTNLYNKTHSVVKIGHKSNSSDLEVEDDIESHDLTDENGETVTPGTIADDEEGVEAEDYETIDEAKPKLFTTIDLYLDNTNLLISGAIKTQVILALRKAKNRSTDAGAGYAPPLQIIDPNIYGPQEAEMSEFITPGVIIAVVFLSSLLFPGLTVIRERRDRQLERWRMAGVRPWEVIAAHLMIHVLILCVQISFVLFSAFVVFEMPIVGSVYLVFGLVFIQGLNGLVYSIAIAGLCRHEMQAIVVWLTTFSAVVVLGGTFWPIECMPRMAILAGKLLPQSIAGNGLRSVLSRGWDASYTTVQLSLLVPVVWIAVLLMVSILVFRIRK